MTSMTRVVGRFALGFVLAVAVLVAAWSAIVPPYNALVSASARPAFRLVEAEDVTVLSAQGDTLWAYRRVAEDRVAPFMVFDRYAFFALVPLLALLAATPGLRLGPRLVRAAGALAILYAVHVVYVVASVELSYAAAGLAPGGPHAVAQWIVRIVWEAAPVAIWLFLTAGAWTRTFRAIRQAAVDWVAPGEGSARERRIIA